MFKKVLIGAILLILIAGIVYIISARGETGTPTPKPTSTPKPGNHIIPELTPTPTPEPKTLDYIYNPAEYYIALSDSSVLGEWARHFGYNITDREIAEFQKQHKIQKGDKVLVRGRVKAPGRIIQFDSPGVIFRLGWTNDSLSPGWRRDLIENIISGKEVVIMVRGTAENTFVIMDPELIEMKVK